MSYSQCISVCLYLNDYYFIVLEWSQYCSKLDVCLVFYCGFHGARVGVWQRPQETFSRWDSLWSSEAGIWKPRPSVSLGCCSQHQRVLEDGADQAHRFSFSSQVERGCLSFWMLVLVKLCNFYKRALTQTAYLIIKVCFLSLYLEKVHSRFLPGRTTLNFLSSETHREHGDEK